MKRRPPIFTHTDTLFPYTTLVRSGDRIDRRTTTRWSLPPPPRSTGSAPSSAPPSAAAAASAATGSRRRSPPARRPPKCPTGRPAAPCSARAFGPKHDAHRLQQDQQVQEGRIILCIVQIIFELRARILDRGAIGIVDLRPADRKSTRLNSRH